MASMNWLGFSLSPQELPSQTQNHGECFDLGSDSTTPLNHLPSSFGMLEAYHRSADNQTQDWGMKSSSEMCMLMGNQQGDEQPKLENFLGNSHSFRENNNNNNNHQNNNGDYMYNTNNTTTSTLHDNTMTNPRVSATTNTDNDNSTNNNGLNVSMIKTWLRSNHPISQQEMINDGVANGSGGGGGALSLSMSTGGVAALPLIATGGGDMESSLSENSSSKQQSDTTNSVSVVSNTTTSINTNLDAQSGALESVPRKSIDTFGQRTSIYRGVTRHRWTGRYEAHLWDNSCRREGQTRKGRQVYLGGYDKEEKAARAYDCAAIKYWGATTTTNFPISDYEKEIEDMKPMTRQEYVASLRRKSSGFSRGASIYRGVTRHHQHGRWQARIGRVAGNKDLYLGTFSTQEEAAEAYDIAAIKFRGLNAVTNFEISRYDVKAILESSTLPIGGAAKRLKEVEDLTTAAERQMIRASTINLTNSENDHSNNSSQLTHDHQHHGMIPNNNFHSWPGIAFQQAQPLTMHYPYGGGNTAGQRMWCKQEQDSNGVTANQYQDLHQQLQLNGGTHNFFQMHNLMGLDNSSSGGLEHSSGSNSVVYGNGNGGNGNGNDGVGNGYGLSFGNTTVISHDGNGNGNGNHGNGYMESNDQAKQNGAYENYYNYLSQQTRGAVGTYDQGSACNNWVPTAIPTLAARTANMAAVGGNAGVVPTFTVWNDT